MLHCFAAHTFVCAAALLPCCCHVAAVLHFAAAVLLHTVVLHFCCRCCCAAATVLLHTVVLHFAAVLLHLPCASVALFGVVLGGDDDVSAPLLYLLLGQIWCCCTLFGPL